MKNYKKIFAGLMLIFIGLVVAACGGDKNDVLSNITNGDFEAGKQDNWTGWTKTGTAFSSRGVINDTKINGITVDKTGDYWFSGMDGGTQKMQGTLTSNTFKLTGTGHIAFKMGAAKNQDKTYVEFFEEGKQEALAKVSNADYNEPYITDQLIRKVVDLSTALNKSIYIKVTDNDNNDDYAYVNLDDFVVCQTAEDEAKYKTERAAQLATYGEPAFEENEKSTTIQNGGFETGDLTGWKQVSGTAFGGECVIPTSQYYWNDRLVYGEGNNYLDGNNNGEIAETAVGTIRSTKFTLAGDGYISFMIGAGASNVHVAINDGATGEELIKITNNTFNDPKLPLTLRRVYVDASKYIGKVLYISIVDNNSTGGFGFITADDFKVSMTNAEVQALMKTTYTKIMEETYTDSYGSLAALQDYYKNYDYPFELPALVITLKAKGIVIAATNSYDLTTAIDKVGITYGSLDITPVITKVVFKEEEFTTGFEAFNFTLEGTYIVHYGATHNEETVSDTFTVLVSSATNVANGGFETGDLTGWTVVSGNISENPISSKSDFWNEGISFNQSGGYHFDGWTATDIEADGYVIRSANFTLSGNGTISFMMGGNSAALRVCLSDGSVIGYYRNTKFSDTSFPNLAGGCRLATMTRYYDDLSSYLGKEVYVELIDDSATSGWGIAFFDDINFYHETVVDVANGFDTVKETNSEEMVNIKYEYAINAAIINGGFETGDLTGWMPSGFTDNAVIDAKTYWNEKLPYNQAGNFHFDGWNAGVAEKQTYTLRSTNFLLCGSGYISLRMGGKASAFKVFKADGTQVGFYMQTRFNDQGFPDASVGSWADMGTYIVDLTAHLGEILYLELCDIETDSWAHAFFDEVITYYESVPNVAEGYDEVIIYTVDPEGQFSIENTYNCPWTLAINTFVAPEN